MCSNESPPASKEPLAVGLSVSNSMSGFLPGLEHYRLQLYHYAMAERIRLAQHLHPQHPQQTTNQSPVVGQAGTGHLGINSGFPTPLPLYPVGAGYSRGLAFSMALLQPHHQQIPEEPKPQHSYIGLIAMAILSSPEKKLVLSDIYQHILEHYPYFRRRGPGWRNSIRHNLSLNDCFVKSGRSANGKGHYWAIHPANLEDFRRGDFRRRKAQRKVRRHMGLAVDEEPESPSPPPLPSTPPSVSLRGPPLVNHSIPVIWSPQHQQQVHESHQTFTTQTLRHASLQPSRKRQFDVASLLAPDDQHIQTSLHPIKSSRLSCSEDEQEQDDEDVEVEIDVVADSERSTVGACPQTMDSQCKWKNSSLNAENQQFSPVHLHNHLHIRNYYLPTNTSTSSSV
ncbi:PREDICTED: fork head domain-containing protein FD4 [Ceratosolen solmsi marchali]|uniref:Fork head domain-containing protein FD4 n=1 Tax=Ceratosolen solmsi marchali TaxID=326594 RepID=A0AAJ7DZR9_9HYME|nr:PREDICTED: fork head domain-containing protein FD4 [Ceratosolen solmsi marchali]